MTQPRNIQYQDVFFPVLPIVTVIVDPGEAAWQGSYEYPLAFNYPQSYQNYLKPSVFWTPTDLDGLNITRAGIQGSNERPLQFQHGTEAWLNVQRPSVFWTPISDRDRGITPAAFQGSNERHLSFRLGPINIGNVYKPNVFQTFISDRDRGITAAAFQGSNVRPNPQLWDRNYLREWYWKETKYVQLPFLLHFNRLMITFTLHQVQMTFGVSCNYQPQDPSSVVFTPEMSLAATWAADAAANVTWTSDPQAAPAWSSDSPAGIPWDPQNPYCKPGQP
jgi:hypothetical protein